MVDEKRIRAIWKWRTSVVDVRANAFMTVNVMEGEDGVPSTETEDYLTFIRDGLAVVDGVHVRAYRCEQNRDVLVTI